jgi:hypothetical protein
MVPRPQIAEQILDAVFQQRQICGKVAAIVIQFEKIEVVHLVESLYTSLPELLPNLLLIFPTRQLP